MESSIDEKKHNAMAPAFIAPLQGAFLNPIVIEDAPHDGLLQLLAFEDVNGISKLTDMAIVCEGTVFPVHQVILVRKSAFFAKCLQPGFKERTARSINLPDQTHVVQAMLQYVYSDEYDDTLVEQDLVAAAGFHVEVYVLADRLQLTGLAQLAAQKYAISLEAALEQDDDSLLLHDVFKRAYEATGSHDRTLRDITLRYLQGRMGQFAEEGTLSRADTISGMAGFTRVLGDVPDLLEDVLLRFCTITPSDQARYFCPGCYEVVCFALCRNQDHTFCMHCGESFTAETWADAKIDERDRRLPSQEL